MQIGLGLCFVPSLVGATQAVRSLMSTLSRVQGALSPPRSQPQFLCWSSVPSVSSGKLISVAPLPAGVNHPESQDGFGQRLEACLQFGRGMLSLRPSLTLSPPCCLLPLARDGLVRSRLALLCYLLSPSFCELAGSTAHILSCYLTLAPSDCHQGIQAWSLS